LFSRLIIQEAPSSRADSAMKRATTKPSVLMVTYQYAPAADGGVARQAQAVAEALAQRGRDISVVTARFPDTPSFERVAGVEVHRVWAIPRAGRFTATFIPSLARFLLLHGRRYDIWHAHQAFYNAGVALRLARVFGKSCVVKDAASGPYGDLARLRRIRLGGFVLKELLRADAIISLNSEMTQELLATGIAPVRIRRIPNGVDCERFVPSSQEQRQEARARLGIPPEAALVLYAGRLAEDTGTQFIIEAWRIIEQEFSQEPWTLIVAGDELGAGEYRKRGERELRNARFVGKVPDVRPLLDAADVLVRPSLTEGMSNIVLEAMASGLPVVGTRTGGLMEQIEDGVTGLLAAPGDAQDLANAMVTLLRDGRRRVSMGSAGRKRAEGGYSLPSVVDAYEALYDQLLQTRDGRQPRE
jgi:glycosyltransferase involved in cell wall biosynthesis